MQGKQRPWLAATLLVLLTITGCSQVPTSGPITPTPGPATPIPLTPATVEDYPWPPTSAPAPTRTLQPTETPVPPTVPPTPAPTSILPTPLPAYAPEGELPENLPPVAYAVRKPGEGVQVWPLRYEQGLLQEELLIDLSSAGSRSEIGYVGPQFVEKLSASPTGRYIGITLLETDSFSEVAVVIDTENGTNQRSLASSDTYDFDLVWSPDGRTIAFSRREDPEGAITTYDRSTLVSSLWLVDVENGEEKQILSSEGQHSYWSPQWLPDGSGLVFLSNRGGEVNVWFVRPDGSGLQQLTRQGGVAGELALLPR